MANTIEQLDLPDGCTVKTGCVPKKLIPDEEMFESLWELHPSEFSEIFIHGKMVKVPRWDQAYEKDYPFAKQVAQALPAPEIVLPYLQWCQSEIDARINGLFVNWHDGSLNHYHGKHRDSVQGLIHDTPIVTVSLGEQRVFRLRTYPDGRPLQDITLDNGDLVVIPWETNQKWTHEVPKFARYKGRRISVTMRAFE